MPNIIMVSSNPKSNDRKKTLAEGQQEYLGTSADLKQVRPALGMDTGTGSLEALAEQAISGETAKDAASRKKYYDARADFWKMMKVAVPIVFTVGLGFYIYMLTMVTGPLRKMEADIDYLRKGNMELNNKIEKLPEDMLTGIGKTIEKIESDIENLNKEDTKLNMEIEKLRKEMENAKRDM